MPTRSYTSHTTKRLKAAANSFQAQFGRRDLSDVQASRITQTLCSDCTRWPLDLSAQLAHLLVEQGMAASPFLLVCREWDTNSSSEDVTSLISIENLENTGTRAEQLLLNQVGWNRSARERSALRPTIVALQSICVQCCIKLTILGPAVKENNSGEKRQRVHSLRSKERWRTYVRLAYTRRIGAQRRPVTDARTCGSYQ